jgi:1-acyl-sn-glycerol-3-phosphate acyltransferase
MGAGTVRVPEPSDGSVVMGDAEVIALASHARRPARCRATTASGRPCRNYAVDERGYCRVHAPKEPAGDDDGGFDEFLRRRLRGDYPVDDFGFDRELFERILIPLSRPIVESYFRVRTLGLKNIPKTGPVLVVANHSGTIALDAVVLQHAIFREHAAHRVLRNIGANLVFQLPLIGPLARKSGNAVAHEADALALLRRGEIVGVFPEGFKGVGKGFRERYRLQRFGRGGFIEIALRAGVPIVPVAIVGAEEAYPMIANIKPLARFLGLPYFPVTPTFPLLGPFGLIPLPTRWTIEIGAPMRFDSYGPDAADDPMVVFDLADEVRDRIQQMLVRTLSSRRGIFL